MVGTYQKKKCFYFLIEYCLKTLCNISNIHLTQVHRFKYDTCMRAEMNEKQIQIVTYEECMYSINVEF